MKFSVYLKKYLYMYYTEDQKILAWEHARQVAGYNPDKYRQDACGAWIAWDKYGEIDNVYGWQIDHIYPQSKGGNDNPLNLRALHVKNNQSKGDDYPSYYASVTSDGNKNKLVRQVFTVNRDKQQQLRKLYNL